jgi:hypothetical protein
MGGILIGAVIPFTLIVIFPTNKKLLDPALDRSSDRVRTLLTKWGRLHAVRTGLSLVALVLLLWCEGRDVTLSQRVDAEAGSVSAPFADFAVHGGQAELSPVA